MTYSFARPLDGLSVLQRLIWPLIFARLWALKLWVRRNYGRGVPYRVSISPLGGVRLLRMPPDACRTAAAPLILARHDFGFSCGCVSAAFRLACAPQETPRAPKPETAVGPRTNAALRPDAGPDTS